MTNAATERGFNDIKSRTAILPLAILAAAFVAIVAGVYAWHWYRPIYLQGQQLERAYEIVRATLAKEPSASLYREVEFTKGELRGSDMACGELRVHGQAMAFAVTRGTAYIDHPGSHPLAASLCRAAPPPAPTR